MDLMSNAGIQFVRTDFSWNIIEPAKDRFVFAEYDRIVNRLVDHNLNVLPIMGYSTQWASSSHSSDWTEWLFHPPKNPDDFADFVASSVERYDGDGLEDAPGSPRIQYWEIWNEENLSGFWKPYPNARDYVQLLRAAYVSAKQADPTCVIVLGGLAGNGVLQWDGGPANYLQQIYDNGGKDYFDVVAIHPYVHPDNGVGSVTSLINGTREVMTANGDLDKQIWITEIGWSTAPDAWGQRTITDEEVARWVKQVYSPHITDIVTKVFWHRFRDAGTDPDELEHHFGLVTSDLRPKAAYSAYQQTTQR